MKKFAVIASFFVPLLLASQASAFVTSTTNNQNVTVTAVSSPIPVNVNAAAASPVPVQESVGNAAASATNPIPVQESIGSAAVSNTNPLVVSAQNTAQVTGTISSATASSTLNMEGASCVYFATTGTPSLTFQAQVNFDTANASWSNVKDVSSGGPYVLAGSTNVGREVCAPGALQFRLNVTSYTSGTLSYTLTPVPSTASYINFSTTSGNTVGSNGISGDGLTTSNVGLNSAGFGFAYNNTGWDRIRKDSYANGPLWVSTGGSATTSIATNTNLSIKSSAGRLVSYLVTTTGTSTAITFYDNSGSSCSSPTGNIIGYISGTATVGTTGTFNMMPAANGILACDGTGSPVVTVSYY